MCADVCLNCCFFGERVLLTEGFLVSCAVVDLPELGERTGEERKCSDFCFLSSFAELLVTSHTVGTQCTPQWLLATQLYDHRCSPF